MPIVLTKVRADGVGVAGGAASDDRNRKASDEDWYLSREESAFPSVGSY
jgi:hypothetical protein